MIIGQPVTPFEEPETGITPPNLRFVDRDLEYRLIQPLRDAAQTQDPLTILARAAAEHLKAARQADADDQRAGADLGNALADLAATGRMAYDALKTGIDRTALEAATGTELAGDANPPTANEIRDAVDRALDRVYAVAWALRGPAAQRAALRQPLGWIAVSSEDDMAHRPVNIGAPPFEQYEIPVTTGGVSLATRFFIASAEEQPAVAIPPDPRAVPPDPVPSVPNGHDVLLFLHGHGGGAEEALDIIPHLLREGLERGKKYSILSFDLPNNGYSQTFNHTDVWDVSETMFPGGIGDHGPITTPALDYIEDFVVAFVDALDAVTPIKNRFAGVFGGSLGGNLGLRLGRRDLTNSPWLGKAIVAWSPASVWTPMVQDEVKRHAPETCMQLCAEDETTYARTKYFFHVYEESHAAGIVHPQPEYWYRPTWDLKKLHVDLSRIARHEIYNANYRRWHWRIGGEQLLYSHFDRVTHDDPTTPIRYTLNMVPMLLATGEADNQLGVQIYDNTQNLAGAMTQLRGRLLPIKDTGHSIHIERPRYFASEIVKFLNAKLMEITCVTQQGSRIQQVGGTNHTDNVPFQMTEAECIAAIRRGDEFFITSADGSGVDVRIAYRRTARVGGVRYYITTAANAMQDDNLLSLPKCE